MSLTDRLQRRALDPACRLAAAQVADGTVPFVVLGVADSIGPIRLEAFSPEGKPRVGTDALCAIASITKPIVATAVMQLVEAGRFPLGDPLATWLPELERPGRLPFGAWHVLSHTSGFDDVDLEPLIAAGGDRPELLRRAFAADQEHAPGAVFHYASTTFDLLVEAVSRALATPFETLLGDGLLTPLGMHDTTFDARPDADRRVVPVEVGWGSSDGRGAHEEGHAGQLADRLADLHLAGGGLWSTAHDLLRFGRAMVRGGELDGVRVLSPAFLELMTRETTVNGLGTAPDPIMASRYALGWGKRGTASVGSATAFGHGGISGTRLWIDPAYDLVFVYLSGAWGMPSQPIDAVLHAVYAALR